MNFTDAVAEAIRSPAAVPWVIAAGLAFTVLQKFPGLLGPWTEQWETWVDARRRTAEKRDDADIADLHRQVQHLSAAVERLRVDLNRRDAILTAHAEWDRFALQEIARLGGSIPPPPGLWPTRTLPEPPTDGSPTDDPKEQDTA